MIRYEKDIIKSLIDLKNNLIKENRNTAPVDELLLKVVK